MAYGRVAPQPDLAAQNAPPRKIALDTNADEKAEELGGTLVTASPLIAKPFHVHGGKTVVGGPDHFDGIVRGIVLVGERYDLPEGKRINVTGAAVGDRTSAARRARPCSSAS